MSGLTPAVERVDFRVGFGAFDPGEMVRAILLVSGRNGN